MTINEIANAAAMEIMDLELEALGDHCLAAQLKPILFKVIARAVATAEVSLSPAERMAAHLAEFGR